ncbi:MAG: hypothetical protein Q9157_005013 [Trypethelium eluteriae]
MPNITLYFLQTSRAIRTAWLLEELGLDYNLEFSERQNGVGPPAFKEAIRKAGNPLGKSPTIVVDGVTVSESGTITEYLCEKYDSSSRLTPKDPATRVQVLQWIHAAEATFLLHSLAILYMQWFSPERVKDSGDLATMQQAASKNVVNDFDWLESELQKGKGKFLVGDHVTAADCMMSFSAQWILEKGLGTQGKKWPTVEEWIKTCEATETWKKAVQKTGHKL